MPNSPLFKTVSRRIQQQARSEFSRSKLGSLLGAARKASKEGPSGQRKLDSALQQYRRLQPQAMIRDALGADFGELVRTVETYSKAGSIQKAAVQAFLTALGPAGGLIRALVGAMPKKAMLQKELELAAQFLKIHGWSVTAPDVKKGQWEAGDMESAIAFLESRGKKVVDADDPGRARTKLPFEIPEQTRRGSQRKVVDIPMDNGRTRRFPVGHPIVTGEMISVESSNVHSYGYDVDAEILYVRYLHASRTSNKRSGPGSLYQYFDIDPKLFLAMYNSPRKGVWIWDELRVRGTVSGHQKDYRLVGITKEYVPRKATINAAGEEVFIKRKVRTSRNRWLTSELAEGLAPRSGVNRRLRSGAPNRAAPTRPNRAAPTRPRRG